MMMMVTIPVTIPVTVDKLAAAATIPVTVDKLALGKDPGPVVEPPLEDSSWTHLGCPPPRFQSGTFTRDEVANTESCCVSL